MPDVICEIYCTGDHSNVFAENNALLTFLMVGLFSSLVTLIKDQLSPQHLNHCTMPWSALAKSPRQCEAACKLSTSYIGTSPVWSYYELIEEESAYRKWRTTSVSPRPRWLKCWVNVCTHEYEILLTRPLTNSLQPVRPPTKGPIRTRV